MLSVLKLYFKSFSKSNFTFNKEVMQIRILNKLI